MGIIKLTILIIFVFLIAFYGIFLLKNFCVENADYEGKIKQIEIINYKEGYSHIYKCNVLFDNNKKVTLEGLICKDLVLGNYLKYNSYFSCWDVSPFEKTKFIWSKPTIFEHTTDDKNNTRVRYD